MTRRRLLVLLPLIGLAVAIGWPSAVGAAALTVTVVGQRLTFPQQWRAGTLPVPAGPSGLGAGFDLATGRTGNRGDVRIIASKGEVELAGVLAVVPPTTTGASGVYDLPAPARGLGRAVAGEVLLVRDGGGAYALLDIRSVTARSVHFLYALASPAGAAPASVWPSGASRSAQRASPSQPAGSGAPHPTAFLRLAVGGRSVVIPEVVTTVKIGIGKAFSFETGAGHADLLVQRSVSARGAADVQLSGLLEVLPRTAGGGGPLAVPGPRRARVPAHPGQVLLVRDAAGGYALVALLSVSASGIEANYALSRVPALAPGTPRAPVPPVTSQKPVAPAGAQVSGRVLPIAVRLQPLQSPNNDFALAAPQGWGFVQGKAENPIAVAPQGSASRPAVEIWALLSISRAVRKSLGGTEACVQQAKTTNILSPFGSLDACYATDLIKAEGQKWSAADAVRILENYQSQSSGVSFSSVQVQSISSTEAVVRLHSSENGVSESDLDFLQMVYVPDQTLYYDQQYGVSGGVAPRPLWKSYAFLGMCMTAQGQLTPFVATCKAILSSFHPAANWLQSYLRQMESQWRSEDSTIVNGAEASLAIAKSTEQLIASTGQQVQQMQYDSFMQNMKTSASITQGWMNALTGTTVLQNPSTGDYIAVSTGFQTYQGYCAGAYGVQGLTNGLSSCGPYQTRMVVPGAG